MGVLEKEPELSLQPVQHHELEFDYDIDSIDPKRVHFTVPPELIRHTSGHLVMGNPHQIQINTHLY